MVKFIPNPEIALTKAEYDPTRHKAMYKVNYAELFKRVYLDNTLPAVPTFRHIILNDLFFVVMFVMGIEIANHPFVVQACDRVEHGPDTKTLDVWARGHFKAIDINEPVPTPNGWRRHGDLSVGDQVFHPSGLPIKVIGKTEVFTDADCYKVSFSNGYEVVVSGDHLWTVNIPSRSRVNGTNVRKKWRTETIDTRELKGHVEHSISTKTRPYPSVNITNPLQYEKSNSLLIDPYVLGVWLGDGRSKGNGITSAHEDADDMESCLSATGIKVSRNTHSNCVTLRLGNGAKNEPWSSEFLEGLRQYNLLGNKHIPQEYLNASVGDRFSLLQGLMDTDGTVHKDHSQAIFCNTNKLLSEQVFELCCSLGLNPTIAKRACQYKGERRPFYQFQFRAFAEVPVFRLKRKAETTLASFGLRRANKIVSVVPVESRPVSCIHVDSEDGLYVVGRSMVPTHNSVIITTAETIQRILKDPEETHVIFSYKKPKAEDFLGAIKRTLESPFLIQCFPDILYANPGSESPSWSLQNGIIVKRKNVSRKEKTVEAYGVIEGMPTGGHWDRRIYDDIETADLAKNPEQLQQLISMFELSKNLGTPNGRERIIGTYYSHCGLLVHLKDKKTIHGESAYITRIIPATEDGKASGKPVFLSQEALDDLKMDRTFNSQQLCNPTPGEEIKFNYSYLNHVEPKLIPKDLIKLMMVDQAGDKDVQTSGKDMWAFGIIGVKPNFDDICASDVYLLDLECGQMGHSEAIDAIVRMYLRGGMILQLGVEKVALSTTEIHIANALKARGRHLSRDNRNLIDLKPAGRSTEKRVEGALQWPLNNGKLFVSKSIPAAYLDKMKEEMDKFPFFHSDILNMIAYGYDMMKDNPYLRYFMGDDEEESDYPDNVVNINRASAGGYG